MHHEIDDIDKRILNILQQDATLPLKNIAEQVHASVATCQRRIQFMMDTRVITKQVAIINPLQLGLGLTAFVLVEMAKKDVTLYTAFEALMQELPNVMSCYKTVGDVDFILLVHAKDMADYHRFIQDHLTFEHNVSKFKGEFVMNFAQVGSKIELK